jgi:nitroreductase
MDVVQAIQERRSIRAFKSDLVPREKIEELLKLAVQAPSAINLQPWEFTVVIGEERERLSRRLIKAYKEKRISCGPGNVKPLPSYVTARGAKSIDGMKPLITEMGSDFDRYINEGSCNFYGAPVAIFLCIDDAFSKANFVDIGITLGYLVLAAHSMGLWTCPIGLITSYEDEIREALSIPEEKRIIISVALGYPDQDAPINRFKAGRETLEKLVRWID